MGICETTARSPIDKIRKAIREQSKIFKVEKYMTICQVEAIFGHEVLSRQVINNWVRKGFVEFSKREGSRTRYVSTESLFKYIEERYKHGYKALHIRDN